MSSFLTPQGLVIKRFDEIKSNILNNLKLKIEEIGEEIETEDKLLGNIVDVFSSEVADVWQGLQEVYDGQILDSSEGKNVDDIALHVSAERLEADCTKTVVALKGKIGTKIERNFILKCVANNELFYLVDDVILSKSNCIEFTAKINDNVIKDKIYTTVVDGYEVSYIAKAGDKENDVCRELVNKFSNDNYIITQKENTYTISSKNFLPFDPYVDQNQLIESVANKSLFYAMNNGAIFCPTDTLNKIVSPVNGLISANNFERPKSIGRLLESDTEYKIRIKKSGALRGQNTIPSLKAKLRNLRGVSDVDIKENKSDRKSLDGIPPKAFEVLIEGGDENEIAKVISENKIGGIETYGSKKIPVLIDNQWLDICFSRPVEVSVIVKIELKIFDDFPENGEQLIKNAVLNYGNRLGINKTLIDQKFFGSIFNSCTGIKGINLTIARKDENIFKNEVQIGRTEYPSFNVNDIMVIKNV